MLTMPLLPLLCAAHALGVNSGSCSGAPTLTDSLPMPPQLCAPGLLGVTCALLLAQKPLTLIGRALHRACHGARRPERRWRSGTWRAAWSSTSRHEHWQPRSTVLPGSLDGRKRQCLPGVNPRDEPQTEPSDKET